MKVLEYFKLKTLRKRTIKKYCQVVYPEPEDIVMYSEQKRRKKIMVHVSINIKLVQN